MRRSSKRKSKEDSGEPVVTETTAPTDSTKKARPLKAIVIVLIVVIVLGGAVFGARKFLLKPKTEATTTSATTAPTSTTASKPPATSLAAAATGSSWSGTVVRAGMHGCGINRSHIFIVSSPEGEKEVRLAGVDSFHFGPVTAQADVQADAMMRGKRATVTPTKVDVLWFEANVKLDDGRDMAEVLAAAGLVQSSDGASSAVQDATKQAREQRRGIYGLFQF